MFSSSPNVITALIQGIDPQPEYLVLEIVRHLSVRWGMKIGIESTIYFSFDFHWYEYLIKYFKISRGLQQA